MTLRTSFNLGLRAPETGAEGGEGGGTGGGGEQKPWYDGFKDAETKTWVESYKGAYPDPEAMAVKARNLEKFIGADKAGRGIILPKDGAKPEEYLPIFRKLGAPEKADGYKLDEKLSKDPLISKYREHAAKIGMPAQHFEGTMQFFTQLAADRAGAAEAEMNQRAEKDMLDLRTEWSGEAYDKNVELGRRAAKTFLPHEDAKQLQETLTRMESACGTKAMMKMWAAIGEGLGEHAFHDGDGPAGGGGMTPEGARVRIAELKKDADWVKRYNNGGAEEKAEFEKLHKISAAGQQQTI